MYQLTQKALNKIDALRPEGIIRRLADALACSDNTINRHIRENEPNGDLTKLAALEVIREATGLSDKQILESAAKKEVA
jgi:hypothetical protein